MNGKGGKCDKTFGEMVLMVLRVVVEQETGSTCKHPQGIMDAVVTPVIRNLLLKRISKTGIIERSESCHMISMIK